MQGSKHADILQVDQYCCASLSKQASSHTIHDNHLTNHPMTKQH